MGKAVKSPVHVAFLFSTVAGTVPEFTRDVNEVSGVYLSLSHSDKDFCINTTSKRN